MAAAMPSKLKPEMILGDHYVLDRFRISGGQAEIWEVRDLNYPSRGTLALKVRYERWDNRDNHEFRRSDERLQQEERLLGGGNHRFIVNPHAKIGGKVEIDGEDYIVSGLVMDLATEGSLREFLESEAFKRFSQLDKLMLLQQMAQGLHGLQHLKIIHNDIKPANVLITDEAGTYIPRHADLGYAFQLGSPIVRGGTPGYMAPEVERGGDPSFESDTYSLAVVFYQVLTGIHPVEGVPTDPGVKQVFGGYYSTHEYFDSAVLDGGYSRSVTDLLHQMGSREPEGRPPITELIETLEGIISEARSHSFAHSEEIVPELAGLYRWAAELHKPFGEREHCILMKARGLRNDARKIAESLEREKIYGFSIHRLLGGHDYLLRIWMRTEDEPRADRALEAWKDQNYRLMIPLFRWPQPPPVTKVPESSSDVLAFLEGLVHPDAGRQAIRAARQSRLIPGLTKTARERKSVTHSTTPRGKPPAEKHAIRVFCTIRASKELTPQFTRLMAKEIWELVVSLPHTAEVEVLASPGGKGALTEFLLVIELNRFHSYGHVLGMIEKRLSELDHEIDPHFQTYLEMDPTPDYESHDGRLLYELRRLRSRVKRYNP